MQKYSQALPMRNYPKWHDSDQQKQLVFVYAALPKPLVYLTFFLEWNYNVLAPGFTEIYQASKYPILLP